MTCSGDASRAPQVSRVTSAATSPMAPQAMYTIDTPLQPQAAAVAAVISGMKPEIAAENW